MCARALGGAVRMVLLGGVIGLVGCGESGGLGLADTGATQDAGGPDGPAPDAADVAPACDGLETSPAFTCGPCGEGVCDPGQSAASCPEDCSPAAAVRYDPVADPLLGFPDDFQTVADPASLTGLRVALSPEDQPGLAAQVPEELLPVLSEVSTLDGFGTSAGIVFRFSRAVDPATLPSGEASAEPGSPLVVGFVDADGPDPAFVRVPVEVVLADDDTTAILWPMVPIPPATRAIAALTRGVRDAAGQPLEPGWATAALLAGTAEPPLDGLAPRIAEALAALRASEAVSGPDEIAGLRVFTTQSVYEDSLDVAVDIRSRPHPITERFGCQDTAEYRLCELAFETGHYRRDGAFARAADGGPVETYALRLNVYLPLAAGPLGGPPYPTILYGHGLSGSREQASVLARFAAPQGVATLAIDAPEHGDHPVRQRDDDLLSVMDFFGISTDQPVDAAILRDNWRQAAWDKLGLVQLVLDGLDADDDGTDDIDAGRLAYLGVSLGGIMGPELLALAPEIGAAVLVVPGARLTDIFQFGGFFTPLVELLRPREATPGDMLRFWPVLQTGIERGDPVNWAPHVLGARLTGTAPTQVLMGMVLDDEIVCQAANFSLARALGIPHVPPVLRPVGVIPLADSAPLADNLPGGGTAGLIQLDWVPADGGGWEPATHVNIGDSAVGVEAWLHFLETWFESGTAEIEDPYVALDLERP